MTINEVFEKYKHLDTLFSDHEWLADNIQGQIIYDLWRAVKGASQQVNPEDGIIPQGNKMDFTYQEAKDLLEFFGGDPQTEVTVVEVAEGDPSHSGPGLYALYTEYPDEGTLLLGNGRADDNQEIDRTESR